MTTSSQEDSEPHTTPVRYNRFMKTIVITSTNKLWKEAQATGKYTRSTIDSSLSEVGFIHATSPDQTVALLNRRFAEREDVLLLLVDLAKVQPQVKFEASLGGTEGLFPHVYARSTSMLYTER